MRSRSYFFLLFLCSFCFLSRADEEQDKAYEDRIHSIYLKNYKDPVTNDEWSSAIDRLKESYQLKYKDNFWDLSESFFRNSLYWSKLWVANPAVENPHRIYKGDTIKFDVKTLSAVNSSEYSTPISNQFPGVTVPPQLYQKDSLKGHKIPSSLPFIKESFSLEPVDDEIHLSLDPIEINKKALLPFYISESKPSQVGKVVGKNGYGHLGFNGGDLVVKVEGDISIGGRYTVFKHRGSLKSGGGYEIQVKGEIKILSYIEGTGTVYRAQITRSLNGINKGDSIAYGESPVFTLSQKGSYGTTNGALIGAPNKKRKMLSLYSIVYLSKGEAQGVRVGDLYYVKAKSSRKFKQYIKRPYAYEYPNIGQLRVIHVSPDVSTALITRTKDQIYLGDLFSGSLGSVSDLDESKDHEEIEDSYDSKENLLEEDSEGREEIEEEDIEGREEVEEEDSEGREEVEKEDTEELEGLEKENLDEGDLEDYEEVEDSEELEEDLEEAEEMEDSEDLDEEDFEEIEDSEELEEGEKANIDMEDVKQEFKDLEDLEEIEE